MAKSQRKDVKTGELEISNRKFISKNHDTVIGYDVHSYWRTWGKGPDKAIVDGDFRISDGSNSVWIGGYVNSPRELKSHIKEMEELQDFIDLYITQLEQALAFTIEHKPTTEEE